MSRLLKILFIAILLVVTICFSATRFSITHAEQQIDFNRDIRPILADKCWACHGPDSANKKIKLRLDSEASSKAVLASGARAIVANHPEQSELIRRIASKEPYEQMPPPTSGRSLSSREITLLTEWIQQGAKWQTHWSFVNPVRPALPEVKNKTWVKNPIDNFVLARLEKEGLQPAPEADRATLLRRVSLDLTGLPPTLAELDNFLNDKSDNAYEKVVDRLLASPRYGERMAFRWLDAARYADTNGYQIDGERFMWRWRDWVIEAFNRNLSFDQFTIEQLAGDMLPPKENLNATFEQKMATAFNRNHRANSEDGLVPEEYAVEYVVDRVDTTSTVFLGLTVGCARCHNHKYDPIAQQEYYQLYAYFNSIPEDGRAANYGNSAPWMSAPTTSQQQQMRTLEQEISRTQNELQRLIDSSEAARQSWEKSLPQNQNSHWFPHENLLVRHALDENSELVINGKLAKIDMSKPDEEVAAKPDDKKDVTGFKEGQPEFVAAPLGQGVQFNHKLFFDAGKTADFNYRDRLKDYKDQFTLSAWVYPEEEQSGAIVTHMSDSPGEKDNNLPKGRGYGLFFNNGKVHFNVVSVWADDSFRVETAEKLPLKQWHHIVATFDSTEPYERAQIFVNGQKQPLKINLARLFRAFGDSSANLRIGGGAGPEFRFKGALDEVRVYTLKLDAEEISVLACADSLEKIAALPVAKRTHAQQQKIINAWLENAAPHTAQNTQKKLYELTNQKVKLEAEFPTLMIMQEMPDPRPAFILRRGEYDKPTTKVTRGIPAALQLAAAQKPPANRLEFAQWLVSAENPLTARVTVNRFWQMIFGTGLVKTVEDFGSQGEAPSHPELLDWLAVEFREGIADFGLQNADWKKSSSADNPQSQIQTPQWNVKALLKTIVTSATYRQSSKVDPQSQIRNPQLDDPNNRLLARAPRLRLSAEMIRDQALFVSGLLVEKLGGASVKTYQPVGLWKDMTFSNMTNYEQAKGEDLWRRSLYTYWRRTILNPAMQVFDASARELCTVREPKTNSPLQALNLMNDVTYVEAARLLAQRAMKEGGTTADDRIVWAFRSVLSRPPSLQERQILTRNFGQQLAYFQANTQAAKKLLSIGEKRNDKNMPAAELAAYAATMSLLLNLDEVITKQ